MPTAIDATVGGAASNSYLSLAAFRARADDTALSGVAGLSVDATAARALLQATARLDLEPWAGTRASTTQKLAWPRAYVPDPDRRLDYSAFGGRDPLGYVQTVDSTIVPERVLAACAELALQLLNGASLSATDATRDIVREKLGPIETEYAVAGVRSAPDALTRYPLVWRSIRPLLNDTARGVGTVRRA